MRVNLNNKRIVIKAPILTHKDRLMGFLGNLIKELLTAHLRPVLLSQNIVSNLSCPCIKVDLTLTNPDELITRMSEAAPDHKVIIIVPLLFDESEGDYKRLETLFDLIDKTAVLNDTNIIVGVEPLHLSNPFFSGTIGYHFKPTHEQIEQAQRFDTFCENKGYHIMIANEEMDLEYFARGYQGE